MRPRPVRTAQSRQLPYSAHSSSEERRDDGLPNSAHSSSAERWDTAGEGRQEAVRRPLRHTSRGTITAGRAAKLCAKLSRAPGRAGVSCRHGVRWAGTAPAASQTTSAPARLSLPLLRQHRARSRSADGASGSRHESGRVSSVVTTSTVSGVITADYEFRPNNPATTFGRNCGPNRHLDGYSCH